MQTPLKSTTLAIVAVLVVIAAGIGFAQTRKDTPSSETTSSPTPDPTTKTASTPQNSESILVGSYTDYTPGIIERTSGAKVLFFHAPWCPQCRTLEASIKAGTIPANTTIIKVDYDSNQTLRKTYGVTLQTTLVSVNDSGNLVKKHVAYDDPSLESLIQNVL